MRLFSQTTELTAVKSICDARNEEVRSYVLGSLNPDWFHFAPAKAAFERIQTIARKKAEIVSWVDLIGDPALDEEFREVLSESEARPIKTLTKATSLVETLDKYRKVRGIYAFAKEALAELQGDKVDVDDLLNICTDKLTALRSNEPLQSVVHTLGKDGNALDAADEAMSEEACKLLLTGFDEYDAKCGGLPDEGVMLMAATTSGGKSVMLQNLLRNIYEKNKVSVCNLSLEMQKHKNTKRMLSMLTGIPFWKYKKGVLSSEEKKISRKAWRRFYKFGEDNGCKYSYVCPTFSVTINQALTLVRPYGYKVIGIDYAGLLEGVDENEQWKMLSAIVRICKIFSSANHCLVVILAQLDMNDGRVRYSGGMLEHADVAWKWSYSKPDQRETHVIPIEQFKARDDELFTLEVGEHFDIMTIKSLARSGDQKHDSNELSEEEPDLSYDAGQQ